MQYEKLSKKAVSCMFVATLVQVIITSAIFWGILLIFGEYFTQIVKNIIIGIILLDILYMIVSPKVRYERYRYSITEDAIDVKEGFLFIERNIVPIENNKNPLWAISNKSVFFVANMDISISDICLDTTKVVTPNTEIIIKLYFINFCNWSLFWLP